MVERALIGFLLAALLSLAAYRLGALSKSGATAAAVVGAIVLGLGGWTAAVLLVVFFLSSSIFTRLSGLIGPEMQASFVKGGPRDALQVLANGLLPAVFSGLMALFPGANWLAGVVGSLAVATADTWATEWGVLANRMPRRITDWKQVPAGTSGGITPLGTLGSLAGALIIGAVVKLMEGSDRLLLIALFSGALGSALDSVLGAIAQVHYTCSSCGKQTEQHPIHNACNAQTTYQSGICWVDNDLVNIAANSFGAMLALLWYST